MSLILALGLQAAVATPAVPPPTPAPSAGPGWAMPALIARDGRASSFAVDLERLRTGGRGTCLAAAPADVLVCGPRRSGGAYPMAMWDRIYAPRPIRAEMALGPHEQARVYNEAVPMDRGAVSNRVMIGLRMGF